MRFASALLGCVPFCAAGAVAAELAATVGAPATSLADAARLTAAADALRLRAFAAEVRYERRWSGGEVTVEFAVRHEPGRPDRCEFRRVRGRHGERTFGAEFDGLAGFAIETPDLLRHFSLVRDPAQASRAYRLVPGGPTTEAGRPADRFRLQPRHAGRGAVELCLDRATGLPLVRRTVGLDGADRGGWSVTALQTDPGPAAARAAITLPALTGGDSGWDAPVAGGLAATVLPAGFVATERRAMAFDGGVVRRTTFTDGVGRCTLLEWPVGSAPWAAMGARTRAAGREAMSQALAAMPAEWRGIGEMLLGRFSGRWEGGHGERRGAGGESKGKWKGHGDGDRNGHGDGNGNGRGEAGAAPDAAPGAEASAPSPGEARRGAPAKATRGRSYGVRTVVDGSEVRIFGDVGHEELQAMAASLRREATAVTTTPR